MNTLYQLTVTCRGRPMLASTVAKRLDAADPGTWDHDHPLTWNTPAIAAYWADHIRFTLGTRYAVIIEEVQR